MAWIWTPQTRNMAHNPATSHSAHVVAVIIATSNAAFNAAYTLTYLIMPGLIDLHRNDAERSTA